MKRYTWYLFTFEIINQRTGHMNFSGKKTTDTNKSPGGLNAHLNWRKLPLVHLGVCYQLEKLWRHSPLVTFYIYIGPPSPTCYPPPGPLGPPWELPWTIFILHLRRSIPFTHYITLLFYLNWIWRRKFEMCKVLALGGPPPGPPWWQHVPYDHLGIPSP